MMNLHKVVAVSLAKPNNLIYYTTNYIMTTGF